MNTTWLFGNERDKCLSAICCGLECSNVEEDQINQRSVVLGKSIALNA